MQGVEMARKRALSYSCKDPVRPLAEQQRGCRRYNMIT